MWRAVGRVLLPSRRCLAPLAVAAVTLTAAWAVQDAGSRHAARLDLSEFGRCDEVYEAWGRDHYIATQTLPYDRGAALLGWAAVGTFGWAVCRGRGRVRVGGTAVGLACVGSAIWLSLAWMICSVFAA